MEPFETYTLHFRCFNLNDKDWFSKNCSYLVVNLGDSEFETEEIESDSNPKYSKTLKIKFFFETKQMIKFRVYDTKKSKNILGTYECLLSTILGSRKLSHEAILEPKKLERNSKIQIQAEKCQNENIQRVEMDYTNLDAEKRLNDYISRCPTYAAEFASFEVVGKNLDKKDLFGKSDPYFTISKKLENSNDYVLIFKSEIIKMTLNPKWKSFNIDLETFSESSPYDKELKIDIWDWNKIGSHDYIGGFETTLKEMMKKNQFSIIEPKKQKKSKYENSGLFQIQKLKIEKETRKINSYSYRKALENLELAKSGRIVIDSPFKFSDFINNIDFSFSFGLQGLAPLAYSFYKRCVIFMNEAMNGYQLSSEHDMFILDVKKPIPNSFGFTKPNNIPLDKGTRNLLDFVQVIEDIQPVVVNQNKPPPFITVRFGALLVGFIEDIIEKAKAYPSKYYILVVLGVTTIQNQELLTEAILKSTNYPISILFVAGPTNLLTQSFCQPNKRFIETFDLRSTHHNFENSRNNIAYIELPREKDQAHFISEVQKAISKHVVEYFQVTKSIPKNPTPKGMVTLSVQLEKLNLPEKKSNILVVAQNEEGDEFQTEILSSGGKLNFSKTMETIYCFEKTQKLVFSVYFQYYELSYMKMSTFKLLGRFQCEMSSILQNNKQQLVGAISNEKNSIIGNIIISCKCIEMNERISNFKTTMNYEILNPIDRLKDFIQRNGENSKESKDALVSLKKLERKDRYWIFYSPYSFENYLSGGLDLKTTFAISFTTKGGILYPDVHKSSSQEFSRIIKSFGSTLSQYSKNKKISAIAFGGKDKKYFPLDGQNYDVNSVNDVLDSYQNFLSSKKTFSAPSKLDLSPIINHKISAPSKLDLSPIINHTIEESKSDLSKYHVLFLLLDKPHAQVNEAKKALIEASKYPISVILITVPYCLEDYFYDLEQLDADGIPLEYKGEYSTRDIVQSVKYFKYKKRSDEVLSSKVLKEFPKQVVEYFARNNIPPSKLTK
eukprot:gene11409-4576_t